MTRFFKSLALAGLLAISAIGFASAQQAPAVQQTGTRADAATGLYGPLGGATTCATVNTTAANATVTITPPGGQYVYITGVYIDLTADVTGVTQVSTLSTTNITGAPFWSLATLVPTAGANGTFRQLAETYATPLKSAAAGVAVTFVPSAQENHLIECIRVAAYFAP
jgi:hypothetical protein